MVIIIMVVMVVIILDHNGYNHDGHKGCNHFWIIMVVTYFEQFDHCSSPSAVFK